MSDPTAEIEAYMRSLSEAKGAALQKLREMIRAAAPDATEKIGYGTPAFYYQGRPLVSYGAAKSHCSFYVQSPTVMEALRDELTRYDTTKGTIRFAVDKPLPAALVRKLVAARIKETDAAKAK